MRPRDALLATGAVATWGVCFVLLGTLLSAGSPLVLAALRSLLGGGALAAMVLGKGGARRLLAPGTGWASIGLLALLNGAVAIGAMFLAAGRADAAAAPVVGNAQPVLLAAAGAALFGERPGRRGVAALALGVLGVVVVAAGSRTAETELDGLALALLASAAPAAGTIVMRRLVGRVDLLVVTAWQFLGGGLGLLAAAVALEAPISLRLGPQEIAVLVFLGAVGTGLAYVVWFGLLERVPLARLGSMLYLVPVSGVTADLLAGGHVTLPELVGLLLLLAGVVLAGAPAGGGRAPGSARLPGALRGGRPSSKGLSQASDPTHSPASG